mmetsp:Transcript_48327/g.65607  ORF Transcript_48327/g.65607 Transcript_48327/m.65607 type:complete len:103 (+) Transcript_48327:258-566(+)
MHHSIRQERGKRLNKALGIQSRCTKCTSLYKSCAALLALKTQAFHSLYLEMPGPLLARLCCSSNHEGFASLHGAAFDHQRRRFPCAASAGPRVVATAKDGGT